MTSQAITDEDVTATILLVDDDRFVRAVVGATLRQRGYTVLEAQTPEEALRLAAWHLGPVHLLVSDVGLGAMTGPELASHVRAARPGVAALFVSGYGREELVAAGTLPADAAFLPKPFRLADLADKIQELLAFRNRAADTAAVSLSPTVAFHPGQSG